MATLELFTVFCQTSRHVPHPAFPIDGHSGDAAVNYVVENLRPTAERALSAAPSAPGHAMREIFHELTDGLRAHMESASASAAKAGTTASLALMSGNELVLGHVGDSRILLCHAGEASPLYVEHEFGSLSHAYTQLLSSAHFLPSTRLHRPDNADELQRVSDAGGRVTFDGIPRVNGVLSMTRALGAFHLVTHGVSAEPDIRELRIDPSRDAFLVLGTDGLFDVVHDDEVVATVMQCQTASEAALALVELSLAYGTRDDATAMVVPLPAWKGHFVAPKPTARNYTRRSS